MKERINITIDISTYNKIRKYNIANLSALVNKLLNNHFQKIEILKSQLLEKGYLEEDLQELINTING